MTGVQTCALPISYELIPNENVSDVQIWVSFGAGALVFFLASALLDRRSGNAPGGGSGTDLALGALLDGIPESLVLGMGIAVGGTVSIGFLVAVFVSNVPEGLSSAGEMRDSHPPGAILRLWIGIAVASGLAGAIGYWFADVLNAADGRYVQAFAAGAVLTMLADSMFPEAYKEGGRTIGLLTAVGFALAAVLTTLE